LKVLRGKRVCAGAVIRIDRPEVISSGMAACKTTEAPATAAPEGSSTVPLRVLDPAEPHGCARKFPPMLNTAQRIIPSHRFIDPPQLRCRSRRESQLAERRNSAGCHRNQVTSIIAIGKLGEKHSAAPV
jgi:hypothetical protein